MARKVLHIPGPWHGDQPIPPATKTGPIVTSGGVSGMDPETGNTPDDVEEQVKWAFEHVRRIMAEAGGTPDDIARLVDEERLIMLSPVAARAFRRSRAPIAIGTMAAVVGLAALNVAPILTKCIDADEGIGAIDGRLLLLIVSMLTLGSALEQSGALTLIIDSIAPLLASVRPILALLLVYMLTSILTELVTNNAVAVLMAPIAAGVALQLGLDPRPFVVAVMFGASASFATPIGYQTNTLVYSAGGYRFLDFMRIGVPMNILIGAVTVLVIPLIWPLAG